MASLRRHQKLLPRLTESVSDGTKTDLLLAKAETISDVGSISVIIYFKKHKKCCTTAAGRDELVNVRANALLAPRSVNKEGKEVLQMLKQSFSGSP